MANDKHVALLKRGWDGWNTWRKQNRDIRPDLREAHLSRADLREANLREANLYGATLTGADLSAADLFDANLTYANLTYADLTHANLSEADLTKAKLSGAYLNGTILSVTNLSEADLTEAFLGQTYLRGASLSGIDLASLLKETVFANVNLADVKGLDTCQHLGPSIIDHRTLQKSGQLPLVFLRGCGLPDNLIEYVPSLFNQPIQFHSCFISYSTQDDDFAKRLHADLQAKGVRCWFAPEDMKIGDKIRTQIDEVIHLQEKLLLVLSRHSIDSAWVEKEVETAFEKERSNQTTTLFPIRLDDAVLDIQSGWAADIKRTRHIGDFRRWKDHNAYQRGLERLLRDLKKAAEIAASGVGGT